jgi:hypothetical protein
MNDNKLILDLFSILPTGITLTKKEGGWEIKEGGGCYFYNSSLYTALLNYIEDRLRLIFREM